MSLQLLRFSDAADLSILKKFVRVQIDEQKSKERTLEQLQEDSSTPYYSAIPWTRMHL